MAKNNPELNINNSIIFLYCIMRLPSQIFFSKVKINNMTSLPICYPSMTCLTYDSVV